MEDSGNYLYGESGGMEMLQAIVFWMTFLGLPIVGIIACTLKRTYSSYNHERQEDTNFLREKKQEKVATKEVPILSNPKIIQYQLVESHQHEPLHFRDFKNKGGARAGP